MDELEKKAQKGLESFGKKGNIKSVKVDLDNLIDEMLDDDGEIINDEIPNGNSKKWIFIVLTILGLCLTGYFGFKDANQSKEVQTPKAVYAQYFEVLPDAMTANERGQGELITTKNDAQLGMEYYNNGEFKKAAEILKLQNEPGYKLFAAISEMKNDNIKSALKLLTIAKNLEGSNRYKDIIDWYLSLAYLKNGNINTAKKTLTLIADGNHYKKEEARSILKSLD